VLSREGVTDHRKVALPLIFMEHLASMPRGEFENRVFAVRHDLRRWWLQYDTAALRSAIEGLAVGMVKNDLALPPWARVPLALVGALTAKGRAVADTIGAIVGETVGQQLNLPPGTGVVLGGATAEGIGGTGRAVKNVFSRRSRIARRIVEIAQQRGKS
jgi:hypothetical protein